jgi:hypothetical protein
MFVSLMCYDFILAFSKKQEKSECVIGYSYYLPIEGIQCPHPLPPPPPKKK